MRNLLFIALLAFISTSIYAEGKKYIYCELVGTSQPFSTKVVVKADFGQAVKLFKGLETIKDEKGKNRKFNSMIDAMNFFGKQGWEFVQAYVVTVENQNTYHWLLKKEVTSEELNEVIKAQE